MNKSKKSGNKNFVIAALVIFLGIAFSIGFFIFTLTGINDNSYKFVAPSETQIFLEEGKYSVFYEYRTEFEGELFATTDQDIQGLKLIIIDKESNKLIDVKLPYSSSTYSVNGTEAYAIYTFEILEDTKVSIESISESGRRVVLNINGGMVGPIMLGVFVLLFGISFSVVAGIIIILLTVSKISKQNKENLKELQSQEEEKEKEEKEEEESVLKMWNDYLLANNLYGSNLEYEAWSFGSDEVMARELADLVMEGKKCSTTSLHMLYEKENEPIPLDKELSVITDWKGKAQCIIETTDVTIKPFNEVDEAFASTEGEGDGSLSFWRKVHIEEFSKELKEYGLEFSEDLLVVCETFKVVFK